MPVTGSGVRVRLWTLSDLIIIYTIVETESVIYAIRATLSRKGS